MPAPRSPDAFRGNRPGWHPGYGRARGFTLIELLVVLVILGTLVSLAVLSVGNGAGRALRDEGDRLATVMALLLEEATLDNREYGLQLRSDGYRVLVYDDLNSRWQRHPDTADYQLPARLQLSLALDGAPLQLAAVPGADDEEEQPAAKGEAPPQLLLLSSGELSPFRLQLSERGKGGAAYELHSDGFSLPHAAPVASR